MKPTTILAGIALLMLTGCVTSYLIPSIWTYSGTKAVTMVGDNLVIVASHETHKTRLSFGPDPQEVGPPPRREYVAAWLRIEGNGKTCALTRTVKLTQIESNSHQVIVPAISEPTALVLGGRGLRDNYQRVAASLKLDSGQLAAFDKEWWQPFSMAAPLDWTTTRSGRLLLIQTNIGSLTAIDLQTGLPCEDARFRKLLGQLPRQQIRIDSSDETGSQPLRRRVVTKLTDDLRSLVQVEQNWVWGRRLPGVSENQRLVTVAGPEGVMQKEVVCDYLDTEGIGDTIFLLTAQMVATNVTDYCVESWDGKTCYRLRYDKLVPKPIWDYRSRRVVLHHGIVTLHKTNAAQPPSGILIWNYEQGTTNYIDLKEVLPGVAVAIEKTAKRK